MQSQRISLVTVCDNNFVLLMATLLKSIEDNHTSPEPIDLYVVDDNISLANKVKFEGSVNKAIVSVFWYKMEDVIPDKALIPFDSTTYPLNIYVRLFIPYFMPQHIKKVIYLDVDMVVLADISKLWNIDIGDKIIGAAQEPFGVVGQNIRNFKELNLKSEAGYFNSGLVIIDMVKWRESDITQKILSCIQENQRFTFYPDQYGLNVVLADGWLRLDPRWNTFSNFDEPDPYIIHFIGYKPIYTDYVGEKRYLDIFNRYLSATPWKGYSPRSKYARYLLKLNRKIRKTLFYRFNSH